MQNNIFNSLKAQVPKRICCKSRREEGIIIVLTEDGELEFLNETASAMFELIDGVRTIEDIFSEMAGIYDVTPFVLKTDIVNFVRSLQWKRIIISN